MIQALRLNRPTPAIEFPGSNGPDRPMGRTRSALPALSLEDERDELRRMNRRLAEVSAESAELMASLEDRNDALDAVNRQIARANAYAAELMAEIDARTEEINRLNSALARANANASEVVAELEIRKEQLEDAFVQLKDEQCARALVEERLVQKQKLEALGTLAGGVAHEINNPLTLVMLSAQILQGSLSSQEDNDLIQEILDGGERVANVVRGIQSFAESEAHRADPSRVQDLVANTLLLSEGNSRVSSEQLTVDIPDDLPPLVCRSSQIQQVILNLLRNGRDALDRSRLAQSERRIRISARQVEGKGEGFVRISVADNGGGVSPETAHRLFDPFFSTKDQIYGAGLGLSVSYRIAQSHGGNLSLDTGVEGWTTVNLDLPLVAREEASDE